MWAFCVQEEVPQKAARAALNPQSVSATTGSFGLAGLLASSRTTR